MLHHPEEVVKKVLEEKNKNSKTSSDRIANKISKELWYELLGDDVKEIIEKSRELVKNATTELQELNEAIQENPKYIVEDNNYIIFTTVNSPTGKVKEKYTLPVELVDNIFNDFSRHWKNMSGMAIQQKYKLKPKVWQLIKNNIWLYKDSHILSPLSMDIAEREGKLDETILEASYENYNDKHKDKYKESHIITLEKLVKKQAKTLGTLEGFLEQIAPVINSIKPIHIEVQKHKNYKRATPVYHMWDTHLGKRETAKVVARLDMMAQDIIKDPSKEVYINCLWDIFEALMQWGMHSWQVETMDGIYGADLFMYGVNIFVDFFKKILKTGKTIHFVGIGGNHDRASTLNEWDNERIYATIFYEMLKAYMANTKMSFQIIREKIGMFEVDGIQYLDHHWERLDKKNPEKIAWKFADTGKQVVLVSAHEHNEQLYTWKNVTHLKINSLAWKNTYDKDLLLDSYPWYSKTVRNEYWLPDIHSKRLP